MPDLIDREAEALIERVGRKASVEDGILVLVWHMAQSPVNSPRFWTLWRKVRELVQRMEDMYGPAPQEWR